MPSFSNFALFTLLPLMNALVTFNAHQKRVVFEALFKMNFEPCFKLDISYTTL